jgi:coenzyme Q-binding protein COQ10
VRRNRETGEIFVSLTKGPFRKLENHWKFHPLSDGSTLVEFWVSYEFSIPWLGKLFNSKQAKAETVILNAFERRAEQRFQKSEPAERHSKAVQEEIAQLQAAQQHG